MNTDKRAPFSIGTRVEKTMGIHRFGTVLGRFIGAESWTDGTYRHPTTREARQWIAVAWDDGTQGYCAKAHLRAVR